MFNKSQRLQITAINNNWQLVMMTINVEHSCIQQMIIFCVSHVYNHMRTHTHTPRIVLYVSNTNSIKFNQNVNDLLPARRRRRRKKIFVSFNCFMTLIFVVEQIYIHNTHSLVFIYTPLCKWSLYVCIMLCMCETYECWKWVVIFLNEVETEKKSLQRNTTKCKANDNICDECQVE